MTVAIAPGQREDPTDVIGVYFDDIGQHIQLSYQEEVMLGKKVQAGDQQAREDLARHNLPLVVSIAKKFSRSSVPFSDLIQEGNIGLMRAVDGFDPDRGVRFSTYATLWIRKYCYAAASNGSSSIRVPAGVRSDRRRLLQAAADFEEREGRAPTDEELSNQFKHRMSVARVGALRRDEIPQAYPVSERNPEPDAGLDDWGKVHSAYCDDYSVDVEEVALADVRKELIERALEQLEPRQALVIRRRFGFDGSEPQSFKQIAKNCGLGSATVSSLCAEACTRLREILQPLELDVA